MKNEMIQVPASLLLQPNVMENGKPCTLVLGIIPVEIINDPDKNMVILGDLIILPKENFESKKHYGWLPDDIIHDWKNVITKDG